MPALPVQPNGPVDLIRSLTNVDSIGTVGPTVTFSTQIASSATLTQVSQWVTPTFIPRTGSPVNITTILNNIPQQTLITFASYIMLQGLFLGVTTIFFYQSIVLHLSKRSWLTLANVLQLMLWIVRNLIIIVFNIAPYYFLDCSWRQYAAGVFSSGVVVCVWWLQFIKFQSMYQNKPIVVRTVLFFCVVCTAATFPYVGTTVKPDALEHCSVTFSPGMQAAFISADVFINVLLSALFAFAILQHVRKTDKTWASYTRLRSLLTCDVRASFLDTAAQLVKLALNLTPGPQTVLGSHVCDFIKVVAAHWFVNDVAGAASAGGGGGGGSKGVSTGQQGQNASMLAAMKRGKGALADGQLVNEMYKKMNRGSGTGVATFASQDTLRAPSISVVALDGGMCAAGSVPELRVVREASETGDGAVGTVGGGHHPRTASSRPASAEAGVGVRSSGSPALGSPHRSMRMARSSDSINVGAMFPKREGRNL
ncbi:hypothetical protein BC830DRAFT_1156881 [Chytriomyces sp. MP71]|nr:hypothetical protein BC830DRAFT_1156881 [Chytriomyces sp. MP71]